MIRTVKYYYITLLGFIPELCDYQSVSVVQGRIHAVSVDLHDIKKHLLYHKRYNYRNGYGVDPFEDLPQSALFFRFFARLFIICDGAYLCPGLVTELLIVVFHLIRHLRQQISP